MSLLLCQNPFAIAQEIADFTAQRQNDHSYDCGAIVSFSGLMRGYDHGRAITKMRLEHYPAMCKKQIAEIEKQAHASWPVQEMRILHRYGDIFPGEAIVLVITAARHRHAAFCAADFMMDYLKTKAPFWKYEIGVDGQAHWVTARQSDVQAAQKWQNGGDREK